MTTVYRAPAVQTWTPGMFERPCGGCTMCCKTPGIPEIGKPPNAWCPNCEKGRGCRVYDQCPEPCRAFYCLWKVMPDFPEELRPDRCKVLWQLKRGREGGNCHRRLSRGLQTRRQHKLHIAFVV